MTGNAQARMQQWLTIAGAGIALLMGIFPPWKQHIVIAGTEISQSMGYAPLFAGPDGPNMEIDFIRLLVQWAVVGLVLWLYPRVVQALAKTP